MRVRAKFDCTSISKDASGANITLNAVYDEDLQTENGRFTKATPSGTIQMRVDNPEASIQFEQGKAYYVDFTPV